MGLLIMHSLNLKSNLQKIKSETKNGIFKCIIMFSTFPFHLVNKHIPF